jgi:mannose-1-phosphate guanylyltransferase
VTTKKYEVIMELYPVIMAGGSGTRFWPASRAHYPKQFLNIIGSGTMVEETLKRTIPLAVQEHTIIVSSEEHHDILYNLLGENHYIILEEPLGRNTAPCIGLAAIYLKKQDILDQPMVVLPADHFIADDEAFQKILTIGGALAQTGDIITIGFVPTRPETGYGYLECGEVKNEIEGGSAYTVKRFVEKPDQKTALDYLNSGNYFWNGGIFIFTPQTILEEIKIHLPEIYAGLQTIEDAMGTSRFSEVLLSVYQRLPSISIDYGVMEKTKRPVLTIPGDFGWSDVGSWESLYDLRKKEQDTQGNLKQGNVLLIDAQSSFVFNQSDKLVVGLGIKDLLIVDTPDVVLVGDVKKSQDIKKIIEALKERKRHHLL